MWVCQHSNPSIALAVCAKTQCEISNAQNSMSCMSHQLDLCQVSFFGFNPGRCRWVPALNVWILHRLCGCSSTGTYNQECKVCQPMPDGHANTDELGLGGGCTSTTFATSGSFVQLPFKLRNGAENSCRSTLLS